VTGQLVVINRTGETHTTFRTDKCEINAIDGIKTLPASLKKMKHYILIVFLFINSICYARNKHEKYMSDIEKKDLIEITEKLMMISKIEIRDTWKGWTGYNYDDYYINDSSYGGTKHFNIILKEDGRSDIGANKIYTIPNFKSAAYDGYTVRIPKRLSKLSHPLIHEIVHFLQHNTIDLDKKYIEYNENNYIEYISQKSELEAHFIQILFIDEYELKKLQIEKSVVGEFKRKVDSSIIDPNKRLDLILYSKSKGII
jgi:hypothetical protein